MTPATTHPPAAGHESLPSTKPRNTAQSLRRQSQIQASYTLLMLLFGAALFIIGLVVVLVLAMAK